MDLIDWAKRIAYSLWYEMRHSVNRPWLSAQLFLHVIVTSLHLLCCYVGRGAASALVVQLLPLLLWCRGAASVFTQMTAFMQLLPLLWCRGASTSPVAICICCIVCIVYGR